MIIDAEEDVKGIISTRMESAYNATSRAMVLTYRNVGRRIAEQEQNGNLTGICFRRVLQSPKKEIVIAEMKQKERLYMQHPIPTAEAEEVEVLADNRQL